MSDAHFGKFMVCSPNMNVFIISCIMTVYPDYGLMAMFGSSVVGYCLHIYGRIYIHLMYRCQ